MNNRFKRQQGLTLVEVMVSLIVGAVILAGVMFTYIAMKGTTRDTLTIGELQETGRLALDIMTADIAQAGFWGTFYESSFTAANTTIPAAPANDCQSGLNNGSFPDGSSVEFRYIFAITSAGGPQLNCIDDTVANSDILQVKRLDGQNVAPGATNAQRFYFLAAQNRAEFSDSPAAVLPRPDATLWPYSHHVYYVQEQTFQVQGQTRVIPTLMRNRLTTGAGGAAPIQSDVIMEGVENIHLLFGLDTNGDSRVDQYSTSNNMTVEQWQQQTAKVLTVQISILIRSLTPDPGLNLRNQTYQLGGVNGRELTFNDEFRRAVFTSTVQLRNVGENLWAI